MPLCRMRDDNKSQGVFDVSREEILYLNDDSGPKAVHELDDAGVAQPRHHADLGHHVFDRLVGDLVARHALDGARGAVEARFVHLRKAKTSDATTTNARITRGMN